MSAYASIQRYEHRLPEALTRSSATLVSLYLRTENEATINELHGALGMKKITLYSLLQTLTATDLVDHAIYTANEANP